MTKPANERDVARSASKLVPNAILLGTVALEPNRWGLLSRDRAPHLATGDWLAAAEAAGFDGIELWEHHATLAGEEEVSRLVCSPLPIAILNSYASFDEADDTARDAAAAWAARLGCRAVKFNIGNDVANLDSYIERLARFAEQLPQETRLICECHGGTAAEDPAVARELLSAVGEPARLQALVHLGDENDTLDAMFSALGDRIRHVHVNFLRQGAPVLAEIADEVQQRVARIRAHGFLGSYTIEFVNGVGGEGDRPHEMVQAAIRDLGTLREVLGRTGTEG